MHGAADNQLQGFMFHPRDGIELKRSFNYARDAQGRALLRIGRSKVTGCGKGSSGLRLDVVSRGGKP